LNTGIETSQFAGDEDGGALQSLQTSVVWLKDGQPVQNRPRTRIHGSKSEKLEVMAVFKEDAGIYQGSI
jgi:hypothetical protein